MEDALFIKILIVGDSGVGKTSILSQYCHGKFEQNISPTIGCDFNYKVLNDYKGRTIRIQLWDIAGQERFGAVSKLYIRGALGCIIVCDATSEDSLNSALRWRDLIEENSDQIAGESIPLILIQNKLDLLDGVAKLEHFQTSDFLTEFAKKNRFVGAYQASAKTNKNLSSSVDLLLEQILKRLVYSADSDVFSRGMSNRQVKGSVRLNSSNLPRNGLAGTGTDKSKKACC